jgi:retron-type reverse transcriptase
LLGTVCRYLIALHKKGDKKTLKNYRPVSLLAVAGMILEKVVALQIEEYFEKNKLLGKFQFGFRRNKSMISELHTLFDTVLEAKEMKKEILIILYDLSAAFDTVPHQIPVEKLRMYGFCKQAIKWMESYLNNRKQFDEVSGKRSCEQEINIGTPQGSRLSPLLFIILMADLNLWTENSTLSNFADDTQSIIVSDNRKNLLETATIEANSAIDFF